MSAEIQAKEHVPWLRKDHDGRITVIPINEWEPGKGGSSRAAKPEEIETGRYFRNIDEYKAANAA